MKDEILTVNRKDLQKIYALNQQEYIQLYLKHNKDDNHPACMFTSGKNAQLFKLFHEKCLYDNEIPKYKVGDIVYHTFYEKYGEVVSIGEIEDSYLIKWNNGNTQIVIAQLLQSIYGKEFSKCSREIKME